MKILSVAAEGFRNIKEETKINLYENTIIMGPNGIGKSTIGEMITWGFLGSSITGNDKLDSILINKESKIMKVTIEFIDDKNLKRKLIRRKGRTVDISLDGKTVKQADLYKFVSNKELFLCIFNAEYFINLSQTAARDLLINILPKLSKEEVLINMDDIYRSLIDNDNFIDANTYMQELRKDITESERDKDYLQGQIDAFEEELRELDSMSNSISIEEEINTLQVELKELKAYEKREISNIKSKIESLTNSKIEFDKFASEDKAKLKSPRDYIELEDISELKKEVALLEGQLIVTNKQLDDVYNLDMSCPTCNQEIDQERKEQLLIELISKSNVFCELKDGLLVTIEEIENINKQMIVDFENSAKDSLNKYTNEIATLDILINESIKFLQEEESNVMNRKSEIILRLKEMESITEKQNKIRTKLSSSEKEFKDCDNKISNIKFKIDALKHYNAKIMELQKKQISQHLDETDIILSKIVKSTGESKDCFEITYKGIEFKLLSTSEKLRAGLEIINLLKYYANADFPVFIDNAECIVSYNSPKGQIIEARVERLLKNLQVVDKTMYDNIPIEELVVILKNSDKELTLNELLNVA